MTESSHRGPDGRAAPTRSSGESSRRARKLFGVGALAVAAVLCYYGATAHVDDPFQLYLGLVMVFLAVLPSLLWARRGTDQLPVFEVMMLTTANVYALPLLNGHSELQVYSTEVVTRSALMVALFQTVAIATHSLIRGRPRRSKFFTEEILTGGLKKYLNYGLLLATAYTFVYVYYEETIPYEINSILRAAFYGIGLVCTFVQARRWGLNDLTVNERSVLVIMLGAQVMMQFSTLFLVGGISIMVLAMVGYVAGSRRLPLVPVVAMFGAVALLHNGKSAMRDKYWDESGYHQQVGFAGMVPFFGEWLEDGMALRSSTGEQDLSKKLFERTSLLHMLCLVGSLTPEHQPYLDGKTYAQIPAQFIPRIIWPDKPLGHISTYTLAIYYGLQSEEDTAKTTIGFGMLAEAYANFGFFGIALLGFVVGAFYKIVQAATAYSPLLSFPGLFLIVLMAWSFQTEYTLSIWISSMFQACVALGGMTAVLKRFFA